MAGAWPITEAIEEATSTSANLTMARFGVRVFTLSHGILSMNIYIAKMLTSLHVDLRIACALLLVTLCDGALLLRGGAAPKRSSDMLACESGGATTLEFFTLDMCPYAQRCWIVLEELGINYKTKAVNLRDEAEKAWFLENVNPRGKVPAVRDDGFVLFESLLINEYLVEKYGPSTGCAALLPAEDPVTRARIRLWNEHLDTQLAPAHFTLLMSKDAAKVVEQRSALDKALQHYEDVLSVEGAGGFLCGDSFTLADAAALPFFERLTFSLSHFKQLDVLASFPLTSAWLDRAIARPSFQATKRPEEDLVALYERFLAMDYSFGGLNKN